MLNETMDKRQAVGKSCLERPKINGYMKSTKQHKREALLFKYDLQILYITMKTNTKHNTFVITARSSFL